MASISIEHVTKLFDSGTPALSDVNLEIADGEQVVVVGPSGCGKSTLLRLIAGLEELTGGTIKIGGRDVTNLAPKDRDVAMVFQDYALYPHMTVRRNMAYALKLRHMPQAEIDTRVAGAADLLGLAPYLDRKPGTLSGGQKQRVALGRAIVREPKAFLMDEPLSNLDAKLRSQMRAEISRLHDRLHVTTLYVTHDQAEAMTLADRIVAMKSGYVQQVASPDVIYDAPANLFVAGFIGSPSMNFFRARLIQDGGSFAVEWRGQRLPVGRTSERLNAYAGQEVIVGVRPEHFSVGETGLQAVVRVVENMGSERFVYMEPVAPGEAGGVIAGDGDITASMLVARETSARPIHRGDVLTLAPDAAHLHLFDPTTEAAIR